MKYLKLFETYGVTYHEITEDEFDDVFSGKYNSIAFTQNEYDIIYDLLKKEDLTIHYSNSAIVPNSIIRVDDLSNTMYEIWKMEDEWFYLEDSSDYYQRYYYKCDQFDGLVDCIKNL